jgi:hypothetical protein
MCDTRNAQSDVLRKSIFVFLVTLTLGVARGVACRAGGATVQRSHDYVTGFCSSAACAAGTATSYGTIGVIA